MVDTETPNYGEPRARGPLVGMRVVEFAGIGPGPYACMLLSDMGADVICINRLGRTRRNQFDFVRRGRTSIELDLKNEADIGKARRLLTKADVLVEGYRPGVMERMGLGPDAVAKLNPRLVYSRMTGWGQTGPLAKTAGHDINYIAITGALDSFRASSGEPVSPLNVVGDYGGGSLFLIVGILAAYIEAQRSTQGQVVDAAMCDGVTSMLTRFHGARQDGTWAPTMRSNFLDGGAHFYRPYECADGLYVAVGAIEPQFYALLRQLAGIDDPDFDAQTDRAAWPKLQEKLAAIFKRKTRDAWMTLFEGTDACVAPILSLDEARVDPHLTARKNFVEYDGNEHPAPAPRFSRTASQIQASPAAAAVSFDVAAEKWSV